MKTWHKILIAATIIGIIAMVVYWYKQKGEKPATDNSESETFPENLVGMSISEAKKAAAGKGYEVITDYEPSVITGNKKIVMLETKLMPIPFERQVTKAYISN